jgi:hypothetical protein
MYILSVERKSSYYCYRYVPSNDDFIEISPKPIDMFPRTDGF